MNMAKAQEAARSCSNIDYRHITLSAIHACNDAVRKFSAAPARETLRDLNSAWVHVERLIKNMPPEAPPAPLGGDTEPARLAA